MADKTWVPNPAPITFVIRSLLALFRGQPTLCPLVDPQGNVVVDPAGNVIGTPGAGDPTYDVLTAFQMWAPGVVLQRELLDALMLQYQLSGPLTQQQVVAICGPLPPYPTGLPRFADSNPDPWDPDGSRGAYYGNEP